MSLVSPNRGAYLAPFTLLAIFLTHSWYGPDVFYHLAWGRDVVMNHSLTPLHAPLLAQPIAANTYWLFQAVLYLTFVTGGLYLGSALFAVGWMLIARAWWKRVRGADLPTLGPWLAVLAVLAAQTRFEQRPEVASYLALAWLIGLCGEIDFDRPLARATVIKMVLLQIVWSNVHGYFALGPLVVAAKMAAQPRAAVRSRGGLLLPAMLMATLVSPFGWATWSAVAGYARFGGRLNDLIQELAPPALSVAVPPLAAFWACFALTIPLLVYVLAKRRDLFAVLLSLGGGALAIGAVRNLPLFFIMSAPAWGYLAEVPRASRRVRLISQTLNAIVCAFFASAFITGAYGNAIGHLGSFGIHLEPASYPIAATEFLNAEKFAGRLFNDSYDGGYLEYNLPAATITGDSYFADVALTREFLNSIRDPVALANLDARVHFDALLINTENLAVFEALRSSPAFGLAHVDAHRALFRRGYLGPARGAYYGGEDLRHWANAFGPTSWIAIARRHRDVGMLKQILTDLKHAPLIPAALIGSALTYDDGHPHCDVITAARALRPRAFTDGTLDLEKLDQLFARVGPCAP